MKKLVATVLALMLTVSMAACGGGETTGSTSGQSVSASSGNSTDSDDSPSAAEISFSGEIGGEITISCYDTMKYRAFLEDAARLFEEKYPGTKVNVETFSAMPEIKTSDQGDKQMVMVQMQDDPQGRQDYINKVNTSMMSGESADILAMDVLPIHKYIESGQLENLAAYMSADPDFNSADYQANVLNAIQYSNGSWFLPVDYEFNYYAYDTTLIPDASGFGTGSAYTVEQLMDMAEDSFDGSNKLFNLADYDKRSGGMWGKLLAESYTSFVDLENKEVNFNDGSFAALLESVKQYSEQGYISKGATGQADAGMMMQRPDAQAADRFFFKPKNAFNLLSLFTRDLGLRMNIMAEGGTMDIGDDDGIAGIAADADGGVPFTYSQAYGINSNSDNKQTAWAFLRFLLSEEMQLNSNLSPTAMPLLNSAREKKAEAALANVGGKPGEAPTEALTEATVKYNEAVEQLSKLINTYVFEDTVVNDMISAEVQYFFEGTKTSDEVANVLQGKIELYLSE